MDLRKFILIGTVIPFLYILVVGVLLRFPGCVA